MTDRELLESAAKAAEHEFFYVGDQICCTWSRNAKTERAERFGPWNPLTDDGDAFSLAKKLRLTVNFNDGTVRNARGELLAVSDVDIRIAIVRAAAEIGKRVDASLVRAEEG